MKKIQTRKWKKEEIEIITDYSLIPKKICPAFGVIKNNDNSHYYFGINRPCMVTMAKEEDGEIKRVKIKQNHTVLIKDNKTALICDEETLNEYHYELESELLLDKPRWEIEHIDKWLAPDKTIPAIESLLSEELFLKIKAQFEYFLDLPKNEWYDYLTLWVMGTYIYSFFEAYPMVYLYGLKNTGKTKVMTLCGLLAFNGELLVGITPATLFRIIEANKPSLFLDEIEKLLDPKREGSADIEAMLNSGYKRGATVPRCEKIKEAQEIRRFNIYCPKMFAHVEGKVSRTLISRCIRIIMERAKPNDLRSERWMEKHAPVWQQLRNELYIWALLEWNRALYYYEGDKKIIKKDIKIDNRAWEIWQPILVLAKLSGNEIFEKMRKLAEEVNNENIEEDKEGREFILIECLSKHISEERYYFVSEIREWLKEEYETENEVPSNRSIGWELKRLGLTQHKREGKGIKWGLSRKIIEQIILKLGVNNAQTTQKYIQQKKETSPTDFSKRTQTTQDTLKSSVVGVESVGSEYRCGETIINNKIIENHNMPSPPPYTYTTLSTPTTLISNILEIIKHLSNSYECIPIEHIIKTAQNAQISQEKAEEAIEYLKAKEIEIFEPRSGFIKLL